LRTGFSLELFCGLALNKNDDCLAHADLLQLAWHHGYDSMRGLGLLCRNKVLRPAGIVTVNDTRGVFLMSVVPVNFGPIRLWFHTAGEQFLHGPSPGHGPVFTDPWASSSGTNGPNRQY